MKLFNRQEETNWLSIAKYGVFFHYLYGMEDMKSFDVDKFAADILKTGAGYVIFTLGQNSGFYCGPNAVFEEITQNSVGSRCYEGDIPMQISKALAPHGVKLMLYSPSHPPSHDIQGAAFFNVSDKAGNDWLMNDASVKSWCKVIKCWAEHYGDNIAGWWFDGFYPWIKLDEAYAEQYKQAVMAGNEHSIIALNQGVEAVAAPANKYCDFTAGEFNDFEHLPNERFVDGAQWHSLSYLGSSWAGRGARYSGEYMAAHIAKANTLGGVVTVDMYIAPDGCLDIDQLAVMEAVKEAIRK